jgi:hypothetical protein
VHFVVEPGKESFQAKGTSFELIFSPAFGLIRLPLSSVSGAIAREPIDLENSKFTRMLLILRKFAD